MSASQSYLIQRILVVQIADIGDLILSTPALAALREAYPNAHITLLTSPHSAPIVEGSGWVDTIIRYRRDTLTHPRQLLRDIGITFDMLGRVRSGHYDTVLFLHHLTHWAGVMKYAGIAYASGSTRRIGLENGKGFFLTHRLPDGGFGARHQAQYWLDLAGLAGASSESRPASIPIRDTDRSWVCSQLPDASPRIVIHAGSGGFSRARRWEPGNFAATADSLVRKFPGAQIILVGGAGDDAAAVGAAMLEPFTDLSEKTTLSQLCALLESADLFIGTDSGVIHMAAAAGVPMITIFGPSNADAWSPWMPNSRSVILRSMPECSPCSYVGHSVGAREGCAARTCMRMVTPMQVLMHARTILSGGYSTLNFLPIEASAVPKISILDFPVSVIDYAAWLNQIEGWIEERPHTWRARHVCTINPEYMMIAGRDSIFAAILRRADLTVPDGVGLLWAARYQGTPLPERVTGSDGVPIIAERAAQTGWRLFFLGAGEGIAERAAAVLRARYPGVQIVGTWSGSPAPEEEDALVARVNRSGADILFVAYGAPEQDKWIARNLPRLEVAMAMGVGGTFDFITGITPRAPGWTQRMGIEWLYRLYLQPWRFRRMLRLPRFVLAILWNRRTE